MKEILELIKEDKIEEAYEKLKVYYAKTKSLEALYYIVVIQLEYKKEDASQEEIKENLIKLTKSNSENALNFALTRLVCYGLDHNDYEMMKKYGKVALSKNIDNLFIHLGYAKGLFYSENATKNYEEVVNHANLTLECDNIPPFLKDETVVFLNEVYLQNGKYEESQQLINKVSLSFEDVNILYELNAQRELFINKDNINVEELVSCTKNSNDEKTYEYITNYLIFNNLTEPLVSYLLILKDDIKDKRGFYAKLSSGYVASEQIEKAISVLKEFEQIEPLEASYMLGEVYAYFGYQEDVVEAIKAFSKCYEEIKQDEILIKIIENTLNAGLDDENTEKDLLELYARLPNNSKVIEMLCELYTHKGDYDKAESICKDAIKRGIQGISHFYYFSTAKRVKDSYKYCQKSIADSDYELARSYYYGEFGYKVKEKLAFKFVDKFKKENEWNCGNSLKGMMMIDTNPQEAFNLFKIGVDRFFLHKSILGACTCVVGCYAYCLLKGIGTSKNVLEAYELAKKVIDQEVIVNDNLVCVYAECAIELGLDLNIVFDYLLKNIDRRYPIGRMFTIVKVGKLLNKDVKEYEMRYKDALKNCNIKEMKYYKKRPDIFMITGY